MKVGLIGGGKMAEAFVRGIVASGVVAVDDVVVNDVSDARCTLLQVSYGVTICRDNCALVTGADVVILAVKPQGLDAVLTEIAPAVTQANLVISIAAGKHLAGIGAFLGAVRLVRVMPNLPATVGEGMSVFCMGPGTSMPDRDTVVRLLASFGKVQELPEAQFDAVTALSGSGPAFFAHYLAEVIAGGCALGLDREAATLLATQTMLGTARLLTEQAITPEELVKAVCSKKGTTEAGMQHLGSPVLGEIVRATLDAAAQRSRELSA